MRRETKVTKALSTTRVVMAILALVAVVGVGLGTASATSPKLKVSVLSNDHPEEPGEPDQKLKGQADASSGGSFKWELVLSHEGEKFVLPKGEKVPKWVKQEVWLEQEVTCVNFFDAGDGSVAAVVAVQVTDSGWVDPEIAGGFPQLFRDSWSVVKFVDGGPDGEGDSFRVGRGDLDPSLQPPAPPFTEERAVEVCESGAVPADGDEPCYGPDAVVIDGVTYGPWFDEEGNPTEVCESWRTTHEAWVIGTGDNLLVDGDISIE